MRKEDYKRLIELCSSWTTTAPYIACNMLDPTKIESAVVSYNPDSKLDDEVLLQKIHAEWDEQVKKDPKKFSRPLMRYKGHTVNYGSNEKAIVTLNLGQTSFMEYSLARKIDPSKAVWGFGPSSFTLIEDDEKKRYILFGDRSKTVAHTTFVAEREFIPKGYFYTDKLSELAKGSEINGSAILENLVRSQLSEQTNFTEEMVNKAILELMGVFLIPHPHFDADVSYAIQVKLPCKAHDFGQFHKVVDGKSKYISSNLVKLEDIAKFVEEQGNYLMPISRLLLYQYAVRHPELAE